MAKKTKLVSDIEAEALRIVDTERTNWDDAIWYSTEKVGFRMREMIRTFRKNFWGIFTNPTDANTGREKFWGPLTMSLVEDWVKNIDLDQKDINFRAKNPDGKNQTALIRAIVKDYLDKIYFGEVIDTMERQLAIDGTVVWKTWKGPDNKMVRTTVDLLHVYIDPTEENIQSAYRFTERGLLTPDQIRGMSGWINTSDVTGDTGLNRNDSGMKSINAQQTTGKFVDVWEMWGKIPKWLVTGNRKDLEEIDGHIIVSGLEKAGGRVHLIEENKTKDRDGNVIKPYEEVRAAVIFGRWYGLGIAERVLALQEYLNTVMNIRINRSYVSQLGLFKIRKGQGITPKMLSNLPSNGAISVNQMDDIEQFQIAGPDATSYQDEEIIRNWATRVTQAFPITSGETLPASATATSVSIQNNNGMSSFAMVKEAIGSFFERWIDRHALPLIVNNYKKGDMIRVAGDDEIFKDEIESIVAQIADEELSNLWENGIVPTEQEVLRAINDAKISLSKNKNLFLELMDKAVIDHVNTKVYVTNESMNVPVVIQNLLQSLQIAPEYRDSIVPQIFDLMGLQKPPLPKPVMPAGMEQSPEMSSIPPDLQKITTQANTLTQ